MGCALTLHDQKYCVIVLIFSLASRKYTESFVFPMCRTHYHIIKGRWICLHISVVDTQLALHPEPRCGDKEIKYLKSLILISVSGQFVRVSSWFSVVSGGTVNCTMQLWTHHRVIMSAVNYLCLPVDWRGVVVPHFFLLSIVTDSCTSTISRL